MDFSSTTFDLLLSRSNTSNMYSVFHSVAGFHRDVVRLNVCIWLVTFMCGAYLEWAYLAEEHSLSLIRRDLHIERHGFCWTATGIRTTGSRIMHLRPQEHGSAFLQTSHVAYTRHGTSPTTRSVPLTWVRPTKGQQRTCWKATYRCDVRSWWHWPKADLWVSVIRHWQWHRCMHNDLACRLLPAWSTLTCPLLVLPERKTAGCSWSLIRPTTTHRSFCRPLPWKRHTMPWIHWSRRTSTKKSGERSPRWAPLYFGFRRCRGRYCGVHSGILAPKERACCCRTGWANTQSTCPASCCPMQSGGRFSRCRPQSDVWHACLWTSARTDRAWRGSSSSTISCFKWIQAFLPFQPLGARWGTWLRAFTSWALWRQAKRRSLLPANYTSRLLVAAQPVFTFHAIGHLFYFFIRTAFWISFWRAGCHNWHQGHRFGDPGPTFTVLSANVTSLLLHYHLLLQCDILLLQKTRLTAYGLTHVYQLLDELGWAALWSEPRPPQRNDSEEVNFSGKCGGVAILYRKTLQFQIAPTSLLQPYPSHYNRIDSYMVFYPLKLAPPFILCLFMVLWEQM